AVVSWLTGLDEPLVIIQGVADTTHLISHAPRKGRVSARRRPRLNRFAYPPLRRPTTLRVIWSIGVPPPVVSPRTQSIVAAENTVPLPPWPSLMTMVAVTSLPGVEPSYIFASTWNDPGVPLPVMS